jgi:hypothetical protein
MTRTIRSFFVGLALGLMYGCKAIGMGDGGFFIYPNVDHFIGTRLIWFETPMEKIAQYSTGAIPELSEYNARHINDRRYPVPQS